MRIEMHSYAYLEIQTNICIKKRWLTAPPLQIRVHIKIFYYPLKTLLSPHHVLNCMRLQKTS